MTDLLKIRLADPGPPVWFFKEGNTDIHLTCVEGHDEASVDLKTLSTNSIAYIIGSVQAGHVTVDKEMSELLVYLVPKQPIYDGNRQESQVQQQQSQLLTQQQVTSLAIANMTSSSKRYQRLEEMNRRCENLVKSSIRALKSGLAYETDKTVLLKVLELEKQGKRRKTILKFVEEKLVKLRKDAIREAVKSSDSFSINDNRHTLGYTPEEEDIELVDFEVIPLSEPMEETLGDSDQ